MLNLRLNVGLVIFIFTFCGELHSWQLFCVHLSLQAHCCHSSPLTMRTIHKDLSAYQLNPSNFKMCGIFFRLPNTLEDDTGHRSGKVSSSTANTKRLRSDIWSEIQEGRLLCLEFSLIFNFEDVLEKIEVNNWKSVTFVEAKCVPQLRRWLRIWFTFPFFLWGNLSFVLPENRRSSNLKPKSPDIFCECGNHSKTCCAPLRSFWTKLNTFQTIREQKSKGKCCMLKREGRGRPCLPGLFTSNQDTCQGLCSAVAPRK